MRVIITGGTGLIGRSLVSLLVPQGYEIIVLSRDAALAARTFSRRGFANIRTVSWDACTAQGWGALMSRECALVNLAGASPAHWRWTPAYRRHMLESRLHAGGAVMEAMAQYRPPAVLIQASAAGYYGDRGQELLTEASLPGQGFRAEVCRAWEASTATAQTRRCVLRTGLVLDLHAGAFPALLRFAQMLGSQVGNGEQFVPWMHTADVAKAIQFLIEQRMLSGPFNLCAPEVVTNQQLLHAVRQVLKRYPVFPLPALVARALLGELATVVLDSQRLLPHRLLEANFPFDYPQLDEALHHVLQKGALLV